MNFPCVFLVDDDSATLESFKIILEHEGYRVFTATSEREFKALLLQQMPDLILMDYNLGEDNGGVLTEKIKRNPQTSHIPVILSSADSEFQAFAQAMGADDYIEKPIEIPLLLSKMAEQIIRE